MEIVPVSYTILPNIILILAVLGVIVVILRHLPEASSLEEGELPGKPEQKLLDKGLPVIAISKVKSLALFWGRRSWHFMLEAKGIKHQAAVGYRIKQIFKKKPAIDQPQVFARPMDISTTITRDEAYFLQGIKNNPKDLSNYSGLAQIYADAKNFGEAKDVYEYLVKHDAGNADFHAKLGYAYYQLGEYSQAVASYEKSLSLDSSHPNRYYNLGLAQKASGNPAGTLDAFQKAAALDSANSKYREALKEAEGEIR